jgi:pyruvate/2-oxoglutarate dehydrogenase complex dihydrolipoamide dehydrogenase (E3) component
MRVVNDKVGGSCTHRGTCPMFALFDRGNQLEYWKQRYCDSEFTRCARYQKMTEGETPPVQLLPSGRMLRLG